MSEPTYNAATDTLVYAANGSDSNYTDLTTMGASPLGSSPRLVPVPSPAANSTAVDSTYEAIVASSLAGGKAYQLTWPVAPDGTQNGPRLALYNCATQTEGRVHYIRANLKFTAPVLPLTTALALKFFKFMCLSIPYTAQQPQYGTHDHLPWNPAGGIYPKRADGTTDVRTFFEGLCGFDDGANDGIQPVGKWLEDFFNDGQWHRFVWGWHPHTAAKKADGVTKLNVTLTSTGTAGVFTAVFDESVAGRITNGQVISLRPTTKSMGPYTVSAFNGTTGCTLTELFSAQDDFAGSQTTTCAFVFDGFMRIWIDGVLVMDISQSAVGQTPTGAKKTWCETPILASVLCDSNNANTENMRWGSDQTNNPREEVRIAYNFGNGDATNTDTLAWWTTPYTTTGTATQLLLSQQPAGAVSGIPMSQQPVVRVADTGGSTVTSDTSTVTAQWISLTGDATPSGTLSKAAVSGVATFTDLGLAWTVASSGYWQFSSGGLVVAQSATFHLSVAGGPTVRRAFRFCTLGRR